MLLHSFPLLCSTSDRKAVAKRYCDLHKKLLWKFLQNSQENNCARVLYSLQLYCNRGSETRVFL